MSCWPNSRRKGRAENAFGEVLNGGLVVGFRHLAQVQIEAGVLPGLDSVDGRYQLGGFLAEQVEHGLLEQFLSCLGNVVPRAPDESAVLREDSRVERDVKGGDGPASRIGRTLDRAGAWS